MPQALDGVPGRRLHGLADPVGDRVEPFGEDPGELRLAAAQRFAHHMDAARGVGLDAGKLRHARFDLLGAAGLACRLEAARPRGARDQDRNPDQGGEQEERNRDEQRNDAAARPPDGKQELPHRALLARFAGPAHALTPQRLALTSPPMATRTILTLPDPRLRLVSKPVGKVDAEIRKLVEDMFETMYGAPGIGLAAVQIGVPKRVVTTDLAKKDEPKNPKVYINPELLWASEERAAYEEGCLSIPEYYEEVERPAHVKVRYTDLDGNEQEIEANGLLATCLQHEIDHLNGVLFIDHISKLKRSRVIKKFAKAARRETEEAE